MMSPATKEDERHEVIREILRDFADIRGDTALGQRAAEILATYDEDRKSESDHVGAALSHAGSNPRVET